MSQVQVRTSEGELRFFATLTEAYKHANIDESVWKISFDTATGELSGSSDSTTARSRTTRSRRTSTRLGSVLR